MQNRQVGFVIVGLMSIAFAGIQGCQQSSTAPDPAAGTIHQGGAGGSGTGTNSGDSGTNNGGPAGVNK